MRRIIEGGIFLTEKGTLSSKATMESSESVPFTNRKVSPFGVKARSFVVIMIVIALSSLILRVALEKIIQFNIAQNESSAQEISKTLSIARFESSRMASSCSPRLLSTSSVRKSPAWVWRLACRRSASSPRFRNPGRSWRMDRVSKSFTRARRAMWTRSSKEPSPVSYRSSGRPSSISSST